MCLLFLHNAYHESSNIHAECLTPAWLLMLCWCNASAVEHLAEPFV